jgi:pentatricopeptide repeat protein
MKAIARQGAPGYAERVEKNLYSIEPEQVAYSVALNAWAKSGSPEAPKRMQNLLTSMDGPNTVVYTVVLDFHARQRMYEKSFEILNQMEADFENGRNPNCRPNAVSYTTVMAALRGAKGVERWKESSALLE